MATTKLKAVAGVLVLVVGLGFGTGLAAWQRGPAAQGAGPVEVKEVARQPATTTDREKEKTPEYVIEPPDILRVQYGRPEGTEPVKITATPLVRPDGTIGLSLFGSVKVSGCTLRQAHAAIAKHLGSRLDAFDAEKLTVDIKEYNSKLVYVIIRDDGEQVIRLPASRCTTVLDALAQAHAVKPTLIGVGKKRVYVERKAGGEQSAQVLPVDLQAIVHEGNTATNHALRSGDRIYIGDAGRRGVVLVPENEKAGRLPRPSMEDVARVLSRSWGSAEVKRVRFLVVSHRVEEPRMYPLVGRARLARTGWRCTVLGEKGSEIVHIEREYLIRCE
jgi:protein involved in polysaccharide export with SLBB domain